MSSHSDSRSMCCEQISRNSSSGGGSLLKRSRLISHNSLSEDVPYHHGGGGGGGRLSRKNEENFFLASSAFPNIIQFTDHSGAVRKSHAFFPDNVVVAMSTESFASSSSSASSGVSVGYHNEHNCLFMSGLGSGEKMEG